MCLDNIYCIALVQEKVRTHTHIYIHILERNNATYFLTIHNMVEIVVKPVKRVM